MNEHDPESEPPGAAPPAAARRRGLVHWLIHQAARRAPAPLAERLEEEWLADLSTRTSSMSRWGFALGCCWATGIIARQHGVVASPAAATGAATGATGTWSEYDREPGLFPRHSLTVISVLGFHLAIIAVLLLGLGGKIQHLATPRLEIHQITNPERPPPRGDLPRPELIHKAFPIPLPDDPRLPDANDDRRINAAPADGSAQADVGSAGAQVLSHAHAVSRVGGGPGTGFPNTDDFYPSLSKFRGEQGMVTVHVCVDASGRLTGEPTLAESSGVSRLDAGALRLAKAGSGHYRASTEDGSPVNSCYLFRVHFRLEN